MDMTRQNKLFLMECNVSECTLSRDHTWVLPSAMYSIATIAGFFVFSLAVFILIFSRNLNTKFFNFWKIFSVNNLLNNIFNMSAILGSILLNLKFYYLQETAYVNDYHFSFYISYIYMSFWAITYTFEGFLSILMVYERILLLNLDLNFMRKTSVLLTSFCVFVFSLIINIPITFARFVKTKNVFVNSNENTQLYSLGQFEYGDNRIFILSIYLSIFIRDVIAAIIEITINVILIFSLSNYHKRRYNLRNTIPNRDRTRFIYLSRSEQKNTLINVLLCSMSSISHILTFLVFFSLEHNFIKLYRNIRPISGIFHSFKNCINLIIFVTLNKQFRKNFLALLPKKIFEKKTSVIVTYRQNECVNLENFATKL